MVGKRALICAGVLLVVACGRGAHAQPPTAGSWGDLLDKARESAGASRASGAREGSLTRSSGRSGEIVGALQRQLVEQLVGKGEIRCVKRNGERQTVYEHMLQAGRKVDLDAPACEVAERDPGPSGCNARFPSGICDADDIDYRGSVSTTGGTLYVFNVVTHLGRPTVQNTLFLKSDGSVVADVYFGNRSTGLYMIGEGRTQVQPIALGGRHAPGHGQTLYSEQEVGTDHGWCERYFARSNYAVRGRMLELVSREMSIVKNQQAYDFDAEGCDRFLAETGGSHAAESGRITDLVGRISRIVASNAKSDREKREEIRILQRNASEELFTTAMRFVPVFADGRLQTFDAYMREQAGGRDDADIRKDPVGAGMSILFDPSTENIAEKVGASDRVREMVESLKLNPFDR